MEMFRKASVVKRVTVTVIALYALLLQGFLVTPVMAFGSHGEITCQQDGSQSQTNGGEQSHHQGPCCTFACAACRSDSFTISSFSIAVFPVRIASIGIWHSALGESTRPLLKNSFFARGPPQTV
jgi:hypothetical protein